MEDIEEPAYVLDYRDIYSCARLDTLIRHPSEEEKTLEIYVRSVHDTTSKPILAKATANPARKTLCVVVAMKRKQKFDVPYDHVLREMSKAHPDRYWYW